ncbi:MAG: class I SAM-dependent methyltransferase [bacterium]
MLTNTALSRGEAYFIERALTLGIEAGKVLDAGCRDGRRAIALAAGAPTLAIIGVDASASAIAAARRSADAARVSDRVRFILADPKRLPLRSAMFDLVMSDALLHDLSATLPALNEISRVARPDGAILVRDVLRSSLLAPWPYLARFAPGVATAERAALAAAARTALSLDEAERLVRRSQLRGVRVFAERGTHFILERRATRS